MKEPEIAERAEQRDAAGQAEQPSGEPGPSTEPGRAGRRDRERPVVLEGERGRVDQAPVRRRGRLAGG